MLKKRIIPVLLLKNGRCVKGKKFKDYRDTGSPVTAAKIYDAQRVDELIFLDIMASVEGRKTLLGIVSETSEQCFMPLTVGGGIRSRDDIEAIMASGADKVVINTAAVEDPDFITQAAREFGSANIVVAVDYACDTRGAREVCTYGGRRRTGLEPLEWAKTAEALGAGEVMVTSIDREGTMTGYDLEFIRSVSASLKIPVIAHGGAGTLEDLKEGLTQGAASAVAVASIFHFTDQSPIKARLYLKNSGVDVRI